MKAQDVMSRDLVTVQPDATILQAARLMLQRKFSGLPVVTAAGELVGIVTEGDFLRRVETGTVVRRPSWMEFLIGPGKLASEYTHAAGRVVSGLRLTFESRRGFPADWPHASLTHAYRNFHHSQAC